MLGQAFFLIAFNNAGFFCRSATASHQDQNGVW
jgi:hypothetical protein